MTAKVLPFVACVLRAAQIPYTPRPQATYMRAWRRRNQGVVDG